MRTNTIHCGECAEMMRQHIPDDSIDLTVTSPPYDNLRDYNGYTFEFEKIAAELWRVTKPGGVVVWVVADATVNGSETGTSFRQALWFMALGFNLHDTMIFEKSNPVPNRSGFRYQSSFEFMFILSKGKPKAFNSIKTQMTKQTLDRQKYTMKSSGFRQRNGELKDRDSWGRYTKTILHNVWRFSVGTGSANVSNHPAPFPEALARDHIISWSNPGDIVFDPMCGSGTTLKMAVEQGREYIGIDVSQEYCDLAQRRVEIAQVPLLV